MSQPARVLALSAEARLDRLYQDKRPSRPWRSDIDASMLDASQRVNATLR